MHILYDHSFINIISSPLKTKKNNQNYKYQHQIDSSRMYRLNVYVHPIVSTVVCR